MKKREPSILRLGVDEAGRGCVIGPLVVAGVVANAADRRWFLRHNVRDSKIVPAAERDRLAPAIKERCWFHLAVATPAMIDAAVGDRSRTLNGLEMELMSQCLRESAAIHCDNALHAIIDAPSIDAIGFGNALRRACDWHASDLLIAKHHADERDRTVAAASIIAKHERERLIAELKRELGCDFGCGYPHNPRTIEHLATVPRNAPHVRWSWKTTRLRTA